MVTYFLDFLPYFLFVIAGFLPLMLFLWILAKDKKLSLNSINKFSTLAFVNLFFGIFGYISFVLPWINIPLLGSMNLIEIFSKNNEIQYLSVLLGIIYFVKIIGAFFQIEYKIYKKSNKTLFFETILSLSTSFIGIIIINGLNEQINHKVKNSIIEFIYSTVSIGFGLYILVILGVLQPILTIILNKK